MKGVECYRFIVLIYLALVNGLVIQAQMTDTIEVASDSLLRSAERNLMNGAMTEARRFAEEAYSLASFGDHHETMGDALMILGQVEQSNGKYSLALRNFFTALREYEWTGSSLKQSRTASIIGEIFTIAGLYDKALEYFNKALLTGGTLLSENEQLAILELIGHANVGLGQEDKAVEIYKTLYGRYQNAGQNVLSISALNQLSDCLNVLGRFQESADYNEEALQLSRKAGYKAGEVAILNNLGYTHKYLGDAETALKYFHEAAETGLEIHAPVQEITVILTNMAIINQNLGRYDDALDNFRKAENLANQAGDRPEVARIRHLMAVTYFLRKDYQNALAYNRDALKLALDAGNAELAASAYLTFSQVSSALYDYETSMQHYLLYLGIRDSLQVAGQAMRQNISQQQYLVERTEKELDEMIYTRQLERMELNQLRLESDKKEQEVELLKRTTDLQASELQNRELEKDRAMQELLLAEERLAAERKDREIKDLKVQQQLQESELRRSELETIRQKQEIQVLTQEKQITELNLQKVRARNRFLAGIMLLALISLALIIRSWRYTRKTNRTLSTQRNKIQQQKEAIESQYEIIKAEREKSEKLLLNILPEETAAELKEKGYASPQHYDKVTVLFTDFVGFTQVSEKMTPQQIVRELDYCFLEFDKIIDKHNLEKIKTIGDSYMCAGGIPVANDSNPEDVVSAALEIRDLMDRIRDARAGQGEDYWRLRIGVHTGPVVAGVVGKNKFAYDIWGDAVNTASRMESSGEAGKVNISGATFEIIKDRFECTYRGKVKAKNKGEVDMYFVEGPK